MSQLPYSLYRASDVRKLDRVAIEEFAMPGIQLMTRAGRAALKVLSARWPRAQHVAVVCGAGNNAGDGYVVARLAREKNLRVSVLALTNPDTLKGDAQTAWKACRAAGVSVVPFDEAGVSILSDADVIVDAIFGTGLDRDVTGAWAEAILAINHHHAPVLALDIPSGLHADDGCVLGVAVLARATVTFIGLKRGLLTGCGPDYCGDIVFDDLGVPADVYEKVITDAVRIDWALLGRLLVPRRKTSHKGDSGHVMLVGGNSGMAGAVRLAAEAAARSGSGLVSVATRLGHIAAMAAARPEIMWQGVETQNHFRRMATRATVIAIGPGLGTDLWAQKMLTTVLEHCDSGVPLVLDADALNLLAQEPFKHEGWVLTPHPGEAARLLDCSVAQINSQRFAAVKELQCQYGGVAILKGAGSLVCDGQGVISLCSDGNPGMAAGGMGDVLTGVIAALLAQGLSLGDAAKAGVTLHAAAGDRAAVSGEKGMLASDLLAWLRCLIN